MPKFEVIRPWHGVVIGDEFEADSVHPSLASHVREVKSGAKLIPATPKDEDAAPVKGKPGPKPKQDAEAGE